MKPATLEFLGAHDVVAGSRALLTLGRERYLIDCGLFQGDKNLRLRNWRPFPTDPSLITAVILTHAHLDHSGYLPKLYREGFRGPIYSSEGTAELTELLLADSAHLQEEDAKFANLSGYSNHKPALPLYTLQDAKNATALIRPHPRDQWIPLSPELRIRFHRAGHIIGASFVELEIQLASGRKTLVFSGDVGFAGLQTIAPPAPLIPCDWLVLESTYGDRSHPKDSDFVEELGRVARQTFERKGVLVIPAFAVGRAQEVIHCLGALEARGEIPSVPVILDSPMSNAATEVFVRHPEDHRKGLRFQKPRQFQMTQSTDESMVACMQEGPMVAISAAGMLSGGRILHHLKHRLPHPENTILFVGYQAEGTKGRFLQDYGKTEGSLRIHHQPVSIEAEIVTLSHLSAHADQGELVRWVGSNVHEHILINHGTPQSQRALKVALDSAIQNARGQAQTVTTASQISFDLEKA